MGAHCENEQRQREALGFASFFFLFLQTNKSTLRIGVISHYTFHCNVDENENILIF